LANAERIDYVAHLIKDQLQEGVYRPRAIVCSAMGSTTNHLLDAGESALADNGVKGESSSSSSSLEAVRALYTDTMDYFQYPPNTRAEVKELLDECEELLTGVSLLQELSAQSLDHLVSYGERCSVRMVAARLNQLGVPAIALDAWEVGIHTDSNFGDAKLLPTYEAACQKAFERIDPNTVAVVTGFLGQDPNGKITTLGRGGSDLTATALGASLNLDEIQVWKDVDGILSSDPRMVPHAVPMAHVSFEEASELAYFGAKILHPIAMHPAMLKNIPVRVKNSYNPSAVGTIIQSRKSDRLVTAITYKKDITVLDIHSTRMLGSYGFLARVFREFAKHKLSVDVLASSEVSVSLTMDQKQPTTEIDALLADLKDCAEITRKENRSIVTLISDVARSSEVLATVFRVFSSQDIQVEMMSQGASKVNISFIIPTKNLETAVLLLHDCFFGEECVIEKFTLPEKQPAEAVVNEDEDMDNLLDVIKNEVAQDRAAAEKQKKDGVPLSTY
jgi:aspartate kinase